MEGMRRTEKKMERTKKSERKDGDKERLFNFFCLTMGLM